MPRTPRTRTPRPEHVHHWRIAEQNGSAALPGTCACGAVREFAASFHEPTTRNSILKRMARRGELSPGPRELARLDPI